MSFEKALCRFRGSDHLREHWFVLLALQSHKENESGKKISKRFLFHHIFHFGFVGYAYSIPLLVLKQVHVISTHNHNLKLARRVFFFSKSCASYPKKGSLYL